MLKLNFVAFNAFIRFDKAVEKKFNEVKRFLNFLDNSLSVALVKRLKPISTTISGIVSPFASF